MLHRLTLNSKKEAEAAIRKGSGSVAVSSSPQEFWEPSFRVSLKKPFHLCQQSLFSFFDLLSFLHSLLKLKQTFVHRRYGWSGNWYQARFSLKVNISSCYLSWGERLWVVFELSLERYSSNYWDPLYPSIRSFRSDWKCAAAWQTPVPFHLLWTHFRVNRLVTCQVPNSQ